VKLELAATGKNTSLEQDLIVPSPGVPPTRLCCKLRAQRVSPSGASRAGRPFSARTLDWHHWLEREDDDNLLDRAHFEERGIFYDLAGNIGTPLIARVEHTSDDSITVVELSSFQLELIEHFAPTLASFLNLTPDHLDRHHSLEALRQRQSAHFENQDGSRQCGAERG